MLKTVERIARCPSSGLSLVEISVASSGRVIARIAGELAPSDFVARESARTQYERHLPRLIEAAAMLRAVEPSAPGAARARKAGGPGLVSCSTKAPQGGATTARLL